MTYSRVQYGIVEYSVSIAEVHMHPGSIVVWCSVVQCTRIYYVVYYQYQYQNQQYVVLFDTVSPILNPEKKGKEKNVINQKSPISAPDYAIYSQCQHTTNILPTIREKGQSRDDRLLDQAVNVRQPIVPISIRSIARIKIYNLSQLLADLGFIFVTLKSLLRFAILEKQSIQYCTVR